MAVTNYIQKFAPTNNDIYKHHSQVIGLYEEAISSEIIKVCINTLTYEHVTPEE